MTNGLIDARLNNKLNELVGECFAINRMLDRGMSLLNVRWKMVNTEKILHPKMAHAFTGDDFADGISGYQAKRSNETIYPATPTGNKEYNSPLDFFYDILGTLLKFQDTLYDTYEMSKEIGDYTTKKFVNKIIENLVDYVDMAQLLIDLMENFGNDKRGWALMDSNIDEYFED